MRTDLVYLESIGWNTHGCSGRGVIVLPFSSRLGVVINSWHCKTCGGDDPCYKDGTTIEPGDIVSLPVGVPSFYSIESDIKADKDSNGNWLSSKYGSTNPSYESLHKIVNVKQCKGFNGDFANGFEFKFRGMYYKATRIDWESFDVVSEKIRNCECV